MTQVHRCSKGKKERTNNIFQAKKEPDLEVPSADEDIHLFSGRQILLESCGQPTTRSTINKYNKKDNLNVFKI